MEKYGVVTELDLFKKSSADTGQETDPACPECGVPLEKVSGSPKCPRHGTKPFEKKGKK